MGRKARASKTQSAKQPILLNPSIAPDYHVAEQTSATDVQNNLEFSPILSDTSRSGKKKSKTSTVCVRRSTRLQLDAGNQELGPVVHEIPITESGNDKQVGENEKDDQPPLREVSKSPEEASDETARNSDKQYPDPADFKYKAMYINSQKKIEALMEESRELNKALEHSVGKIDVLEKQSHVFSEVLDVLASLAKTNENLSDQVNCCNSIHGGDGARASKRNRKE